MSRRRLTVFETVSIDSLPRMTVRSPFWLGRQQRPVVLPKASGSRRYRGRYICLGESYSRFAGRYSAALRCAAYFPGSQSVSSTLGKTLSCFDPSYPSVVGSSKRISSKIFFVALSPNLWLSTYRDFSLCKKRISPRQTSILPTLIDQQQREPFRSSTGNYYYIWSWTFSLQIFLTATVEKNTSQNKILNQNRWISRGSRHQLLTFPIKNTVFSDNIKDIVPNY